MNITQHEDTFSQETTPPTVLKDHTLPRFGVVTSIISFILVLLSLTEIANGTQFVFFSTLILICAVYHTFLGFLTVYSSRDGIRYRGFIIACLILAIIGPCLLVFATIYSGMFSWLTTNHYSYEVSGTLRGVVILSFGLCVLDLALACISSCNLCYPSGCYRSGNEDTNNTSYSQSPLPSPPPRYSCLTPPPSYETVMTRFQYDNLVANPTIVITMENNTH